MGAIMGMGIQMGITRIDARGRITLPQALRDALALLPGDPVLVEKAEDGIVVRRARSKQDASRQLRGIITSKNAVSEIDPMELKRLLHASD
ncbi:MAG TPA: AbrB/MazE/SpoVT family DNA-binding domain-containing protein [Thermoplasmata archaeon]